MGPRAPWTVRPWATGLALVVLGMAALQIAGPGSAPAGAQVDDEVAADDCLPSAGTGEIEDGTLTNRLIPPRTIPDPVRLGLGRAPERYAIELETRLRRDASVLRAAPNFDVIARLTRSNGASVEQDAFVVTAAARNRRSIELQVCLDPNPASGRLGAGTYRADVEFIDPRIPETTLSFEVWVGGAAGAGYVVVVVAIGALLLAAAPVAVVVGAAAGGRSWRAELRGTLTWLLPLLGIGGLVYAVSAVTFLTTNRYHLWSASLDGAGEFLGYVLGRLTIVLSAATALLAVVPKWREAWGRLFARESAAAAAPATTAAAEPVAEPYPGLPPEPVPAVAEGPGDRRPDDEPVPVPAGLPRAPVAAVPRATEPGSRPDTPEGWEAAPSSVEVPPLVRVTAAARAPGRGSPVARWLALSGAAVAAAVGVVAVTLAVDGDDTGIDGSTTTSGGDVTGPLPEPREVLEDMEVGVTPGDEAVADLRAAGFVVFDYLVCSNSVPEAGRLREVSETETQELLVGSDGPTGAVETVEPSTSLDVLITSGDPCPTG